MSSGANVAKNGSRIIRMLQNIRVDHAISGVLVFFVLNLLLVSALGLMAARNGTDAIGHVTAVNGQQKTVGRSEAHLYAARSALEAASAYMNEERRSMAQRQIARSGASLAAATAEHERFVEDREHMGSSGNGLADQFQSDFANTLAHIRNQKEALEQGDATAFRAIRDELALDIAALQESARSFLAFTDTLAESDLTEYEAESQWGHGIMLGSLVLSGLMLLLIRYGLRRVVTDPIQMAVDHLRRIAEGDLSCRLENMGRNEIGQLFGAMERMRSSIGDMVGKIRAGSDSIYTGSREISAGNSDLSARTEQQASSLEETASSMEELTATVKQNADNAQQASATANQASETATRGGEAVESVVGTMREISESSQKITDITGLIDSIAFQTNILALNASVEAARAGDQGRGFAVVAGEVRELAKRSSDAAKEIKELIEDSVKRVQSGSDLVENAGSTMDDVVQSVRQVTDLIDEISSASREQSGGIAQANEAIALMDEGTQKNAALVQEAAVAANSLEEQASRMEEMVALFKLPADVFDVEQAEPESAQADSLSDVEKSGESDTRRVSQESGGTRNARVEPNQADEWVEF